MPGTHRPTLSLLFIGAASWFVYRLLPAVSDTGLHIRVGRYILERGQIPEADFLTFTAPGRPWVTQEWATGLLFAVTERGGGITGLFLLQAVLFASALLILTGVALRQRSEPFTAALLLLLTALALLTQSTLRGLLVSQLLLCVFLALAESLRRDPTRKTLLWAFPPLLLLWACCHGLFVVGLAFFGLILVEWVFLLPRRTGELLDRVEWAAGLMALSGALMLLNPHGVRVFEPPFSYLFGEARRINASYPFIEWTPLHVLSPLGSIWLVLALLLAFSAALRPRVLLAMVPESLLGLALLVLTLRIQRHLPLAALLLFPVVSRALLIPLGEALGRGRKLRYLAGLSLQEGLPRSRFGKAVPFLLAIAAAAAGGPLDHSRLQGEDYPVRALSRLEALPPGRLYADYNWSGAAAWLAPAFPLFVSPDITVDPAPVFAESMAIAGAESGWKSSLDRWEVRYVLARKGSPLARALGQEAGWSSAFEDSQATLFRRTR